MIRFLTLLISLLLASVFTQHNAQTLYFSAASGNWNTAATWSVVSFVPLPFPPFFTTTTGPASTPPTTGDYVNIVTGHNISVNSSAAASTVYINSDGALAKLTISAANTATIDSLILTPTVSGISQVENNGTLTTFKTKLTISSATANCEFINNGIHTNTLTEFNEANGTALITLNGSSSYTTTDISTANSNIANTTIDLSSGNGIFEVLGDFTGNDITLTGGTAGSTIRYAGTAAQTINASKASFTFDNLEITNTVGASLDADLTVSNLNGNINVNSGIFNLGGFNIGMNGNITNSGTINANGNIDIIGDITLSGTYTSTGSNINIEGNWNNTGTYTFQTGDIVTFDGSGANSSIDGNTNFYELVINKPSLTVNVNSGATDITSILDLDAGTFNVASGATATLLSNASGTAQLDVIEGGATYSGDLVVQRFLAMSNDGWRELTSPVTGTSLANWQDDGILLTGFTGADYDASNWFGWVNSWTYNETSAGGVRDDGWAEATNNTNATTFTKGHRIYIGTGNNTLSVKGAPNNGFTLVNVTNGGSGSGDDQNGWNLIGNPYPCTVDWNTLTHVSVDAAYWIWNATAGNYGIYQTGAGSGTNGVDNNIAHSQAFWVHASAASGFLIFSETSKVRTDKAFVKSSTNDEFVRIKLSSNVNSFYDEALLTFNPNASESYDYGIDQNKLYSELVDLAPSLAIVTDDNAELSIAGVNELKNRTIPLKAYAGNTAYGTYTIEFELPSNTLLTSCISLEDLETGIITDLKATNSYTFTTSASSPQDRFLIHITTPFEAEFFEPTCSDLIDGEIILNGNNVNGNTFTLSNSNGVINTVVASNNQISFNSLTGDSYTITSSQNSSCGHNSIEVILNTPQEIIASFDLAEDIIYLDQNTTIAPQNNSNGTNYTWNFGDGNTSFDENPTHSYTTPGFYTITLVAETNGCENTKTETIEVRTSTTISEMEELGYNIITNDDNLIISIEDKILNGVIKLTTINGKEVYKTNLNSKNTIVNTTEYASGVYLITISSQDKQTTQKVIIR